MYTISNINGQCRINIIEWYILPGHCVHNAQNTTSNNYKKKKQTNKFYLFIFAA